MACKTTFNWCHDFPKLANDSGFAFNLQRQRVQIDWNQIRIIDIEKIVRDRDFATIEKHINDVVDVRLESEFDLRILDSGVVKLFRLAQLTVEYQQFCRQYLDRSVVVLRDELQSNNQELERLRKDIKCRDEELRRNRKRSKSHHYRNPLQMGNENIANMILKTLSSNNITSIGESLSNYNKCQYCDKVFLNQLYLQAHILRRHSTPSQQIKHTAPTTVDADDRHNATPPNTSETDRLNKEIQQLKDKLNELSKSQVDDSGLTKEGSVEERILLDERHKIEQDLKKMMDEWKKEERMKSEQEMNELRKQLIDNMNEIKQSAANTVTGNDAAVMDEMRSTVSKQADEINQLKSHIIEIGEQNRDESTLNEKLKQQEILWRNKLTEQELQHESKMEELMRTLHNVYAEIKAVRNNADSRASKLDVVVHDSTQTVEIETEQSKVNSSSPKQKTHKPTSIEELHKKAKELLSRNLETDLSSSTLENSDHIDSKPLQKKVSISNSRSYPSIVNSNVNGKKTPYTKDKIAKAGLKKNKSQSLKNISRDSKSKTLNGSPAKVVRAKLCEEVNSRLQTLGIDPLKNGINKTVYKQCKHNLDKLQESISKNDAEYGRVRNNIINYLETKISDDAEITNTNRTKQLNSAKHNTNFKKFFSNVKMKAISLMKPNERESRIERNMITDEITKRVAESLRTPPGSSPTSPVRHRKGSLDKPKQILQKTINGTMSKSMDLITTMQDSHTLRINQSDDESQDSTNSDNVPAMIKVTTSAVAHENARLQSRRTSVDRTSPKISPVKIKDSIEDLKSGSNPNSLYVNASDSELSDSGKFTYNSRKFVSDENLLLRNSPKGVLKHANSTSSLSKKKVLFDMDAIQMKSVSASPSQSATENSDRINNAVEADDGTVLTKDFNNDWDLSSIEDEPVKETKTDTTLFRRSQKITDLTQRIESQLAIRSDKKPIGGVDLRQPSINLLLSGSNTSIGSSLLDDSNEVGSSETVQTNNLKIPTPAPRSRANSSKNESDVDISDWSIEDIMKGK